MARARTSFPEIVANTERELIVDALKSARGNAAKAARPGLRVGCYVGTDFWYSGKLDEVRVSDCVRYDPEGKLAVGGRAFNLPPNVPWWLPVVGSAFAMVRDFSARTIPP